MQGGPWAHIAEEISDELGVDFRPDSVKPIGGGCINEAVQLSDGTTSFFVKTNTKALKGMFDAEALGMKALAAANAIRVPEVYLTGVAGSCSWIAMEYLEFGTSSRAGYSALGAQLAEQHRVTHDHFGFECDNTIGSTPQPNSYHESWVSFLRDQRLGFQFALAAQAGCAFEGADRLLAALPEFFANYTPEPSLLHGDLWSGNVAFSCENQPIVFDPAVYYGDREAEFGIIAMFGGFDQSFFEAYEEAYPFQSGSESRQDLYLLYHQLNHFNLFGSSYRESVRGTMGAYWVRLIEEESSELPANGPVKGFFSL